MLSVIHRPQGAGSSSCSLCRSRSPCSLPSALGSFPAVTDATPEVLDRITVAPVLLVAPITETGRVHVSFKTLL